MHKPLDLISSTAPPEEKSNPELGMRSTTELHPSSQKVFKIKRYLEFMNNVYNNSTTMKQPG
jgi:hypothetical protein